MLLLLKQRIHCLVILYWPNEPKHEYGLLKIDFLHENNMDQHLPVEANSGRALGNAREIRGFFGIGYGDDIGDRLNTFYRYWANSYLLRFLQK